MRPNGFAKFFEWTRVHRSFHAMLIYGLGMTTFRLQTISSIFLAIWARAVAVLVFGIDGDAPFLLAAA